MFGKRFEEIISTAYVKPSHDLSYETAVFAEAGGEIVGMASGYTAEQHHRFDKKVVDRAAGRSMIRIAIVYALISPMMRFLHTYDEGDFYLQFLAVDEAFRGRGIGSSLLQAMEERGRELGSTQYAIDVSGRNNGAHRLYERYGFADHACWPRLRWMPTMIHRLVKPF